MRLGRDVLELDLYDLLRVPVSATPLEIRRAYRRQARASHPDLNPLDAEAAGRMSRLNLAAQVLLDHDRRARYDRARGVFPNESAAKAPAAHHAADLEWEVVPKKNRVRLTRDLQVFIRTLRSLPGRSAEQISTTLSAWPAQRHGAVLVVALLVTIGLIAHAKPRSLSFWCSPDCPPQPVSASRL